MQNFTTLQDLQNIQGDPIQPVVNTVPNQSFMGKMGSFLQNPNVQDMLFNLSKSFQDDTRYVNYNGIPIPVKKGRGEMLGNFANMQMDSMRGRQDADRMGGLYGEALGQPIPQGQFRNPQEVSEFMTNINAIENARSMRDYRKAQLDNMSGMFGGAKNEFSTLVQFMNSPEFANLPENQQAMIISRAETLSKDPNRLYAEKYAERRGIGDGTIPTAEIIKNLEQTGVNRSNLEYAGPIARETAINRELMQFNPQGRLTPIEGSKQYIEQQTEMNNRVRSAETVQRMGRTVIEDADRALNVLSPFSTGLAGLSAPIPGTAAKELQGHIDSVKANIGIDTLLNIKKSGAGLGQVPQSQLDMLASSIGNLSITQNPRVLRENLERIRNIYSEIVAVSGQDIEMLKGVYGGQQPQQGQQLPPVPQIQNQGNNMQNPQVDPLEAEMRRRGLL